MIARMARTVASRRRMVAYYAALALVGVASMTLGTLPATTFGAGYAVGGALGIAARWRHRHRDEAWVIVGLAVLSCWQGLVLWVGESPDGGLAEILTSLRLMIAPLMMIDYAARLSREHRWT